MEKIKGTIQRKKKPADIETIKKLIEQADVSINRIEKDLSISRSLLLRGLNYPESKVALPPKWETPIIRYLKKKITEKKDAEIQTTEVLQELGFKTPEQESDLKEELKENKRKWIEILQK